mgnify:FL=1
MTKITAIIPVKGKSSRIKNKNLKKFHKSSLYEIKLDQLSKCKNFDEMIVSSESEKVLNIAKKKNFKTHKRDKKFSTDTVPMSDVYKNIASEINCENIAWINVTNPLVSSKEYDEAAKKFKSLNLKKYDCLLSVFEIQDYFIYKNKPINFKRTPWPRSQDLQGLLSLSFAINILKRENMIKWKSCVGKKPYYFKLSQLTSWDIDFIHDFRFCEYIYKQKNK